MTGSQTLHGMYLKQNSSTAASQCIERCKLPGFLGKTLIWMGSTTGDTKFAYKFTFKIFPVIFAGHALYSG
jgi:hypothetical protein